MLVVWKCNICIVTYVLPVIQNTCPDAYLEGVTISQRTHSALRTSYVCF